LHIRTANPSLYAAKKRQFLLPGKTKKSLTKVFNGLCESCWSQALLGGLIPRILNGVL
jgi:hypothetical protein